MLVPSGFSITLFDSRDFWVKNAYGVFTTGGAIVGVFGVGGTP